MLPKLWMHKINVRMPFQNIYLYSHLHLCLSNYYCTRYHCITYCLSCSYIYGNFTLRMLSSLLTSKPFLCFWFGLLPYRHVSWHMQGSFWVLSGSDAVYIDVHSRNNCQLGIINCLLVILYTYFLKLINHSVWVY